MRRFEWVIEWLIKLRVTTRGPASWLRFDPLFEVVASGSAGVDVPDGDGILILFEGPAPSFFRPRFFGFGRTSSKRPIVEGESTDHPDFSDDNRLARRGSRSFFFPRSLLLPASSRPVNAQPNSVRQNQIWGRWTYQYHVAAVNASLKGQVRGSMFHAKITPVRDCRYTSWECNGRPRLHECQEFKLSFWGTNPIQCRPHSNWQNPVKTKRETSTQEADRG